MKDSGKRDNYNGSAVRDSRDGRGRYDLISPIALHRLARVYEEGAKGKGERNWEQGIPLSRFVDSAQRHIQQFLAGARDEDHIAQAIWNLCGLIHTQDQIARGSLPDELHDLPQFIKNDQGFYNWDNLPVSKKCNKDKRFYIAASVRGKNGDKATISEMTANISRAITKAKFIQKLFPENKFYIPHMHEDLFTQAFVHGLISSEQVLNQCFNILSLCGCVIVLTNPAESEGVRREVRLAQHLGIYVIRLYGVDMEYWQEKFESYFKGQ